VTTLQICAASLDSGQPLVLLSARHPAGAALAAAGLLLLERSGTALQRPGHLASTLVPLPPDAPFLAVLAEDAAGAAVLAEGLPPGVARLGAGDPRPALFQLLAQRLTQEILRHRGTEQERIATLRTLGMQPQTLPEVVLTHAPAPDGGVMPARVRQPLGRPVEGLCTVELHLAGAGPRSLLRAWLSVGGRVMGAWVVPGPALVPGWLPLDLPSPLPPGQAAVLDVAIDLAETDRLALSAGHTPAGPAALALRLQAAGPARQVLPQYFDWAATGQAIAPGLLHALPEGALSAARLTGARGRLVAAGAEPPRLLLELPPGGTADLLLPSMPCGVADLAVLDLACPDGAAGTLEATLLAGPPEAAAPRRSPPQRADAEGHLHLALPLPATPGGAVRLGLRLHHAGTVPLTVEMSRFGLMLGALGEPRAQPLAPPALKSEPAPDGPGSIALPVSPPPPPATPAPPAAAAAPREVALPDPIAASIAAPGPSPSFRSAPPQPPLVATAPPQPERPPVTAMIGSDSSVTAYRDLRLHQHMANPEGTYRHLEVTLSGLVSSAGLWRQVRFKLFDRRGTIGLEFRDLKGWPQMFDIWPPGRSDKFGPFWRLETEDTAAALLQLATPHDRALVHALLDVLPGVAQRGGAVAELDPVEQDRWAERARLLVNVSIAGLAGTIPGGPPSA